MRCPAHVQENRMKSIQRPMRAWEGTSGARLWAHLKATGALIIRVQRTFRVAGAVGGNVWGTLVGPP